MQSRQADHRPLSTALPSHPTRTSRRENTPAAAVGFGQGFGLTSQLEQLLAGVQDLLEHLMAVAGRTSDDSQHLDGGSLLVTSRFGKRPCILQVQLDSRKGLG